MLFTQIQHEFNVFNINLSDDDGVWVRNNSFNLQLLGISLHRSLLSVILNIILFIYEWSIFQGNAIEGKSQSKKIILC